MPPSRARTGAGRPALQRTARRPIVRRRDRGDRSQRVHRLGARDPPRRRRRSPSPGIDRRPPGRRPPGGPPRPRRPRRPAAPRSCATCSPAPTPSCTWPAGPGCATARPASTSPATATTCSPRRRVLAAATRAGAGGVVVVGVRRLARRPGVPARTTPCARPAATPVRRRRPRTPARRPAPPAPRCACCGRSRWSGPGSARTWRSTTGSAPRSSGRPIEVFGGLHRSRDVTDVRAVVARHRPAGRPRREPAAPPARRREPRHRPGPHARRAARRRAARRRRPARRPRHRRPPPTIPTTRWPTPPAARPTLGWVPTTDLDDVVAAQLGRLRAAA